jgi:hypothetical protein
MGKTFRAMLPGAGISAPAPWDALRVARAGKGGGAPLSPPYPDAVLRSA